MVNPNFWATLVRAESMGILSDEGIAVLHEHRLAAARGPAPLTCADAAAITAALFQIGDIVRLKSERRQMTVSSVGCVDITCMWMNGDALDEADFHHTMLTKAPYPDELPF